MLLVNLLLCRSPRRPAKEYSRNVFQECQILEWENPGSPAHLRESILRAFVISEVDHAQHIEGVNYVYIKKGALYFCATCKVNVSPTFVVELLNRLTKVFKDYCGVLTEESIRTNFVLVYELLDEIVVRPYRPSHSVV